MKKFLLVIVTLCLYSQVPAKQKHRIKDAITFVFVSDNHYGITRNSFRDSVTVQSTVVNKAMVAAINSLPQAQLPQDGGVMAGQKIEHLAFIVDGGDISNRMQKGIQCAEKSWKQFWNDFGEISTTDKKGRRSPLYLMPGNHDVSNAIGHFKTMTPENDPTVMVELYNRMMKPAFAKTSTNYDYEKGKIHYSFSVAGTRFQFINMWPDSSERSWMVRDFAKVKPKTPIIVFGHDEPDIEKSHFTNPNFPHDINTEHKFENLLAEHYRSDGVSGTAIHQREFSEFVAKHKNIKAYFHGNANWTEFYYYKGPDGNIQLPVFRVDSPMKGKYSSKDESLLSFLVVSIDPKANKMTVRECFYNKKDTTSNYNLQFGQNKTIEL